MTSSTSETGARPPVTAKAVQRIPSWLRGRLAEEDLAKIAEAVGRAEARTSGEIVPIVVRSSSAQGHAAAFTFALVALGLWILSPFAQIGAVAFGFEVSLWILEIAALALSALVTTGLARSEGWRRLLIAPVDRVLNAHRRAELEFFESRINSTEAQTGVLLFVSLLERRAVVLADEAIAKKLAPDAWKEVVELILGGIRQGDFTGGMSAAIEKSGDLLALGFPAARHDRNELPNELVIRE